jgi:hypothetical protein
MPLGLLILAVGVALFALVAVVCGADSRDGSDWNLHHRI